MQTQQRAMNNFVRICLKLSRQECEVLSSSSLSHPVLLHINHLQTAAASGAGVGAVAVAVIASQSSQRQQRNSMSLSKAKGKDNFLINNQNSCHPIMFQRSQLLCRSYSKFTVACDPPTLGSTPLCEQRAHDLIFNLKDSERDAIKTALKKYEAMKLKEGLEGKLAATRWRTRFGRLSRVPALGIVDPTGSYCEFPDDWLKKKAAEKAQEPTRSDLWKIFFLNAVPFIGFGFLDNFTMIIAGDYIEHIFGTFMCISTMAAAGLGNTISDVLGIGSAFYVERGCELMGLRAPDLTPIQLEMKSSRRSANYGRIIGITIGCIVGMAPLLFMDKKPSNSDEAVHPAPTNEATSEAIKPKVT